MPVDDKQKYSYFARFSLGLARLDKLSRVSQIDITELDNLLYNRMTLESLFKLLPKEDFKKFKRLMSQTGLDWKNPTGIRSFILLKQFCDNERDILEPYKSIESGVTKSKPLAVHATIQNPPPPPCNQGIHATNQSPPRSWYPKNLIFPCPITGHSHEMNTCKQFFSMTPEERWTGIPKRMICFSCLRPKNRCNNYKCMFMSSIPEELTCQACVETAKVKGFNPFNILFCRKRAHAETRAPYDSIKSTFEKYLGRFTPGINDWDLKYSVNFMKQVYTAIPCNPTMDCKCCEIPSGLSMSTPSINTQTGAMKPSNVSSIIPETQDHSFYMMQILKFGNENVLTFFDSGANLNLISGELAADLNLQTISKKPSKLTVVGGSLVRTEYGTYQCCLGPNESGNYYELTCQGIDKVTSEFKQYDLSEISKEFKDNTDPDLASEPTPPYIGGSDVKLLIGIKNTNLSPILLKILPSSIAVYRSPFTDIWGSRLIFAGPHSSFTKANGAIKADISNAIFHMKQDAEIRPWEEKQIPFSITVDKRFNISIHPHPLNEEDILDVGGR